tara:strand:+ start:1836 stop:2282 length:447 start_codon:yes stop_codon:yes gene_type:complete
MSKVRADLFTNRTSDGAPDFPFGLQTVGIITAAGFSGSFEASGLTGTPSIDVANVNATGVVTASNGLDGIGIHSGGTVIHSGVITALNFVGTGNTFAVNGATVDISIAGGGGSGLMVVLTRAGTAVTVATSANTLNVVARSGTIGVPV